MFDLWTIALFSLILWRENPRITVIFSVSVYGTFLLVCGSLCFGTNDYVVILVQKVKSI